jgi:ketosteroid isomerase-like protein
VSSSSSEVVRKGLRLWSEGDLEGSIATMRPDVEWHLYFELPDLPTGKRVYRGHDEVRQVWEAFRSVWDEITVELEEFLEEEEDGRLLARARFRGRGGASGIEIDRPVFYVFDIDDKDLLTRLRPFDSEEQTRKVFDSEAG